MLRVLCAPDKFKGTLTAREAAEAMCRGAMRASDDVRATALPMADGGEGTLDAVAGPMGAEIRTARVLGPLCQEVKARFGWVSFSRTAVVELAEAAGLALVPTSNRDPTRTTTFGVGQLIQHALAAGAKTVLVAVGGSATVDGGCGMAQALGAKFFDARGQLLSQPITGGMLHQIGRIESPGEVPEIVVLCDVTNPLLGQHGAARTYAPQKGATDAQVEELESGLAHLAHVAGGDPYAAGAGAAGGTAYGLQAMCGASLERGIDVVKDVLDFYALTVGVNLLLTGEGRLDAQSLNGKVCNSIAVTAAVDGAATIAIVGSTGPGAEDCTNPATGGYLHSYVSLAREFGEKRALREPAVLIEQVAERIVRDWAR